MLGDMCAAETLIASITDRQKSVMDLILQHRTSKEIARELGISPNTVDQRINAVRAKLGGKDRADTARLYRQLNELCGKTIYDPSALDLQLRMDIPSPQEVEIKPNFLLNDSGSRPQDNWESIGDLLIPRARFSDSALWRISLIFAIAVGVLFTVVTTLSGMQLLTSIIQ